MDPSDIIRLLSTHHYAPANLEEVRDLCRNYPEFNLAHLLKVRILESLGHNTRRDLKIAAIYSSNRTKLYQLVTKANQEPAQTIEETQVSGTEPEERDEIEFSDSPELHADVIIKQHAPYASSEPQEELLELDDEVDGEEAFELDTSEGDISSEADISSEPDISPEAKKTPDQKPQSESTNLIENFLKGDPGPIRASKKITLKGDASRSSIREHDGFITDTLAKIYVKQGLVAKAIYAYEKLSLKYPEKSAYFAAQIEKIENISHS
jgi:hypothetical protein